jgi:hypothetical protein
MTDYDTYPINGVQVVAGSNPAAPTIKSGTKTICYVKPSPASIQSVRKKQFLECLNLVKIRFELSEIFNLISIV